MTSQLAVSLGKLFKKIEQMDRTINQQNVKMNNMFREASVSEVDFDTGLAVVKAHGIESKQVPWMQQAGAVNEWTPLSEKQRVILVSPGGDMGRAFVMPGGYSDQTKAPHNKGAEKRVTIGGAVITHSGQGLNIKIGGSTFVFTEEGLNVYVGGTTYSFTGDGFMQTGGKQEHDGKNVGSDHKHGGVVPGGAKTTGPE